VAIAKAIEAAIGKRQGQRTDKELPENFPEVHRGAETREIAAERAGFGNPKTYQQARRVVEHGIAELVEAMDAGERRGEVMWKIFHNIKGSREVAAERAG
jgi:ParB family chromosome partitioning protein